MSETVNITVNDTIETVSLVVNEVNETIAISVTEVVETVNLEVSDNVTVLVPSAFEQRMVEQERLSPILLLEDVILGNLETVQMPSGNPNIIGIVQQIDEDDGGRVFYPNFTTTPDGRSAIFQSVLTKTNNKIIIWPRKPES